MKYFLVGVGLGALIGLVYAPMPGEETRGKIADTLDKVSENAGNTIKNLNETAAQVLRGKQTKEYSVSS